MVKSARIKKIKYVEILNTVAKMIKKRFPTLKIYAEQMQKGAEFPCVFIQIIPLTTIVENSLYNQKNVMVNIVYYESANLNNNSINRGYDFMEEIEELLQNGITIDEKRHLNISNFTYYVNDENYKDVNLSFELMWYNINMETITENDNLDYMQEFYIDLLEK